MDRELFDKIMEKYGEVNQKRMLQEELAELIQAISKDCRGLQNNVEEEIADVIVLLEQMRYIYSEALIKSYRDYKIERLRRKVEE